MNGLFQYVIESTLILGVFLIFFEFILKGGKSFQYNRYFLLIAPLLSLLFPLLEIPFIQGLKSSESLSFVYELPTMVTGVTTFIEPAPQLSIPGWLWIVYYIGVAIFTLKIMVQLSRINDIITFAKKRIHAGDYTLVLARNPVPTFAFLHYIVIGSDKSIDEKKIVHSLNHEKVHIRQRHTIDVLIMEFLTIVFWFNPILYYYKRIIRENHEFLADQQASQDEPMAYSLAILKELQKGINNSIPNYFSMQFTRKRLHMITNYKSPYVALKPMASLPLILLLFIAFSCQNEFLEQKIEPVKKIDADFYSYAPSEFAKMMADLKLEYPTKSFYFKVIKDIDLEIVKAQYQGIDIDYYQEVSYKKKDSYKYKGVKYDYDRTIVGIGMIYSWENDQGPNFGSFNFDEKIYTRYEVSQLPEPWLGEDHLNEMILSNTQAPDAEFENIHGTIWVRFTVNPYGNIINSHPLKNNLNTKDIGIINRFYGSALVIVGKLSGYYKPGELRDNKVNVEMVLPVTF